MVSVIIPVYNAEKFLTECLNSVLNQTYKEIEVLLIDDGSTDNSGKICDEFAKKDERVKVIHQKNKGASGARNCGIDLSQGEYIVFVDADDVVSREMVERYVDAIEKTGADICVSELSMRTKNFEFPAKIEKENFTEYSAQEVLKDLIANRISNLGSVTKLLRKTAIDKIRFSEEIFIWEDALFFIECITEMKKVVYLPEVHYYYRNSVEHSTTSVNFSKKALTLLIAYDKAENILSKKMPQLIPVLRIRKSSSALHIIDIMIKLEIPFYNGAYQKFYKILMENRKEIMRNSELSKKARAGFVLLIFNEKLYRWIKRLLYRKNYAIKGRTV